MFSCFDKLERVVIPDNVISIGNYGFSGVAT